MVPLLPHGVQGPQGEPGIVGTERGGIWLTTYKILQRLKWPFKLNGLKTEQIFSHL